MFKTEISLKEFPSIGFCGNCQVSIDAKTTPPIYASEAGIYGLKLYNVYNNSFRFKQFLE